jgi:hypothetical protein
MPFPIGDAQETLSGEGQLILCYRIRSPPGGLTRPKARRIAFLPTALILTNDGLPSGRAAVEDGYYRLYDGILIFDAAPL